MPNKKTKRLEQNYDSVLITHTQQQLFGLTVNADYTGNVNTLLRQLKK